MALKPSKITSELLLTCNKFFSSSADTTLKCRIPSTLSSQKECVKSTPSFRYTIANTGKPEDLPEIVFQEKPTTLFADLQPAANPEYRTEQKSAKWTEQPIENIPFPSSIKPKITRTLTYSDQQKAEDRLLKYKMQSFNPSSRQMSTVCVRRYSRGPADNSGSANCMKNTNKCYKAKRKDCKVGSKDCPRLKILDCAQSKGSNCRLNYLDPKCSKKFAPYPSYSETCAETLPDDPSECQQCPWRICDSADTIEPGKPARHRRNYSTSCSRHLGVTAGIVLGPVLTPPVAEVQEHLCKGNCGNSKQPCKQPPGPCEVRRQKEEQKKREKIPQIPPKSKKALEDVNRMVLTTVGDNSDQHIILNSYALEADKFSLEGSSANQKSSWVDIIETEELSLHKKQKHPNCHRDKKPRRPKNSDVDQDLSIEYGNADWWSGRGKKSVIIDSQDSCESRDCEKGKCGNITIKSKQVMPHADIKAFLSEKGPKKIKGDEGHPPPCEEGNGGSLRCPEKPIKKPKYKKRPMSEGYYKIPPDPYNPSNGK